MHLRQEQKMNIYRFPQRLVSKLPPSFAIGLLFYIDRSLDPPAWSKAIHSLRPYRRANVRSIELLDHLDAGSAVLGDLIDVCAFHEAEADIGMP
tara:strand:+ start:343 stop:624 length:282 start_codon:yes stop_codon:yes gene_type:complete